MPTPNFTNPDLKNLYDAIVAGGSGGDATAINQETQIDQGTTLIENTNEIVVHTNDIANSLVTTNIVVPQTAADLLALAISEGADQDYSISKLLYSFTEQASVGELLSVIKGVLDRIDGGVNAGFVPEGDSGTVFVPFVSDEKTTVALAIADVEAQINTYFDASTANYNNVNIVITNYLVGATNTFVAVATLVESL